MTNINGTRDRIVNTDPSAGGSGGSGGAVTQGTNPWTVDGSVGIANFPADYPDASADASLDQIEKKFIPTLGSPVTVSASGPTTVHTPAAGKKIRLLWIGLSSPDTNGATTIVEVRFDATAIYRWAMGPPGAFAHGAFREGANDEPLVVNLSAAQTVYVNFDLVEV